VLRAYPSWPGKVSTAPLAIILRSFICCPIASPFKLFTIT
jgi:hypothetical protein